MEKKLLGVLDLEERRNSKPEDLESGVYCLLEEKLRNATFNKVINYMLDNATAEDKEIVEGVRNYLSQENGSTTRVEVTCYKRSLDGDGAEKLEKVYCPDGTALAYLETQVTPYIQPSGRNKEHECLEMVLSLVTGNGSK